jgi:hypothetical protein
MDEDPACPGSEEAQDFVFEDIVPKRDKRCGASIHDRDTVDLANLLNQLVESLIVDCATTQNVDVFGAKSLIPGSGVKSDIRQDSRGRRASILAKI